MKVYRGVFLKNTNEINLLREANRYGQIILDAMEAEVAPGVATMRFEEIAQDLCNKFNVKPAFQGYLGYPHALCCSVNEEIVHGFPSPSRILQEGDIVSFDMGVVYEGFFGDSARTIAVGEISAEAKRLLRVTRESLMCGIDAAKTGNTLNDVSFAIQDHAEKNKLGIIRRFVGHGIGRKLHEKPEIPNFVPAFGNALPLKAGMVLAIEPMLTLGTHEVDILSDNWTAVTRDKSLAAHFEYSIAITPQGPEILGIA